MKTLMKTGLIMAMFTLAPMSFAQETLPANASESADYFSPALPDAPMTYSRGDVLPVEFGEHDWQDYYSYGLPAAPRGFEWVLVDNDAYLVTPETGLIDLVIEDIVGMEALS